MPPAFLPSADFDIDDVGDAVLLNVFNDIKSVAATAAAATYLTINYEKLYHAHQIHRNKNVIDDLAGALASLGVHANHAISTTQTQQNSRNRSPWELAIEDCYARLRVVENRNINTVVDARSCAWLMIDRYGYSPLPFMGRLNTDTYCLMLYAVSSDRYYRIDRELPRRLTLSLFQIEVVTHLNLCGGFPAATETVQIEMYQPLGVVVDRIFATHNRYQEDPSSRFGGLPKEAQSNEWFFQRATHLSALDMDRDQWHRVYGETIQDIKSWRPGQHVFIMHVSIRILPSFLGLSVSVYMNMPTVGNINIFAGDREPI